MVNIGIDKLINRTNSVYKLAVLASMRAYELSQGANRLVDMEPNTKFYTVALREILEGKIAYKTKSK